MSSTAGGARWSIQTLERKMLDEDLEFLEALRTFGLWDQFWRN